MAFLLPSETACTPSMEYVSLWINLPLLSYGLLLNSFLRSQGPSFGRARPRDSTQTWDTSLLSLPIFAASQAFVPMSSHTFTLICKAGSIIILTLLEQGNWSTVRWKWFCSKNPLLTTRPHPGLYYRSTQITETLTQNNSGLPRCRACWGSLRTCRLGGSGQSGRTEM